MTTDTEEELPTYAAVALQRARSLATKVSDSRLTYTVVEAIACEPFRTRAPNGSSEGFDYLTVVTTCQDYASTPENGIYAGRSYRVTDIWHSSNEEGTGSTIIDSSYQPW